MSDLASGFADLFSGRTDAYGTGRGEVIRQEVFLGNYAAHLAGMGAGLGIFPLLDDGTVRFAAIDIDRPDFGLALRLQQRLPSPTFIERSRSGNAHVWAFFAEPIEAWVVRAVLQGYLDAEGEFGVEVFPKQDSLLPGMVGNYINLPLFGAARPIVGLFGPNDHEDEWGLSEWTPEGFVEAARTRRQDSAEWWQRADELGAVAPQEREPAREFGTDETLHVCAEYILQGARTGERPIVAGHRSVVYFNFAKQLLMYERLTEEEAWDLVQEVNLLSPDPLTNRELRRIFTNAASGRWTSWGCDDPVFSVYADPSCPIAKGA